MKSTSQAIHLRLITLFSLAALIFGGQSAIGLTLSLPAQHPGQIGLQKANPTGTAKAMGKISPMLSRVYAEYTTHQKKSPGRAFQSANPFLKVSHGKVLVDVIASDDSDTLLKDLERLGLQKGTRYGAVVSGRLPLAVLDRAAALPGLRYISASVPITNAGLVTSQGDVAMKSDIARTVNGLNGTGVLVGVLSDSYDQQEGAAADVDSGDLPVDVDVLDDSGVCTDGLGQPQPCTDEGRAMAQIVHDVAPGADIAFHTAFNGIAGFANGINALALAGADVIVDDVIYLGEPMFQDGAIARAVDQAASQGVAYFSAAGNSGRDSYQQAWQGSGEILYLSLDLGGGVIYEIEIGEMQDFNPSAGAPAKDTMQRIDVPEGQCMIVVVQWDSPFGSGALGTGTQNDLDVFLANADGTEMLTWDGHENIPTGEPVEAIQFCNDGLLYPVQPYVNLIIALWDGDPPGLIKHVAFGAATVVDYATDSGTIYGHANAAGAEAVGAAYYMDTPEFQNSPSIPLLEDFSSAGGVPILLDSTGNLLSTPEVRTKPGIVAPDGVDTTFFYPSSNRNGNEWPDFSGTSAAAPHAAAVAALLLESDPSATPTDIFTALRSTALDMTGVPGYDEDSGYGLVQADAAVLALGSTGGGNTPPTASFTFTPTELTVNFTDTSLDNDGSVNSWSWDFGDGMTSTAQNPSRTYSESGTYSVMLTATDNESATGSVSLDVTVSGGAANAPPVASFEYSCIAKDCVFTDLSSDPDVGGGVINWMWDFGDSDSWTSSSSGSTAHTYANQGNYTVTLTVTDYPGENSAVSATFRVKNKGAVSGSVSASGGGGGGGGEPVATIEAERGKKKCGDGIDNDGDGLTDGDDPDCQ